MGEEGGDGAAGAGFSFGGFEAFEPAEEDAELFFLLGGEVVEVGAAVVDLPELSSVEGEELLVMREDDVMAVIEG